MHRVFTKVGRSFSFFTPMVLKNEKTTISEITEFLYDKNIDFADCYDANSLRRRYEEVNRGTYVDNKRGKKIAELCKLREKNTPIDPTTLSNPNFRSKSRAFVSEEDATAITLDPYPSMQRYGVDPTKYVWEVKQELCRQKGYDPEQMEIVVGDTALEDYRKMGDYPQVQCSPVYIRNRKPR